MLEGTRRAEGRQASQRRRIVVGVHAENTRIGGTAAGARNVIAGHGNPLSFTSFGLLIGQDSESTTVQGNYIGLAADGTTAKPNTIGSRVDKTAGALIGGHRARRRDRRRRGSASGIELNGGTSRGVVVEGNLIGTDATGTADRGNGQDGIFRRTRRLAGRRHRDGSAQSSPDRLPAAGRPAGRLERDQGRRDRRSTA